MLFYDWNYLGFLTWKSEDVPVSLSENLHSWAFVCKLVCLARFHLAGASVHSLCVCVLACLTRQKPNDRPSQITGAQSAG